MTRQDVISLEVTWLDEASYGEDAWANGSAVMVLRLASPGGTWLGMTARDEARSDATT